MHLRERRGLIRADCARKARLNPSEFFQWEANGAPIPRTKRIVNSLARALEVEPDLLWEYFLGNIDIDDLPASLAQKRQALPAQWVESLYPIVDIEPERVGRILEKLRDRILGSED